MFVMDAKERTNEMFRLAFAHLKATRGGTLKRIALACGCTDKHIGNILRKDKPVGSSAEIKQGVAAFYSTTVDDMLIMGQGLLDGQLPPPTTDHSARIGDNNHHAIAASNSTVTTSYDVDLSPKVSTDLTPKEFEALQAIRHFGDLALDVMLLFGEYGSRAALKGCYNTLMDARASKSAPPQF